LTRLCLVALLLTFGLGTVRAGEQSPLDILAIDSRNQHLLETQWNLHLSLADRIDFPTRTIFMTVNRIRATLAQGRRACHLAEAFLDKDFRERARIQRITPTLRSPMVISRLADGPIVEWTSESRVLVLEGSAAEAFGHLYGLNMVPAVRREHLLAMIKRGRALFWLDSELGFAITSPEAMVEVKRLGRVKHWLCCSRAVSADEADAIAVAWASMVADGTADALLRGIRLSAAIP